MLTMARRGGAAAAGAEAAAADVDVDGGGGGGAAFGGAGIAAAASAWALPRAPDTCSDVRDALVGAKAARLAAAAAAAGRSSIGSLDGAASDEPRCVAAADEPARHAEAAAT
jgi:hypothetical protein